jgi:hypothetical protein
LGNSLRLGLGFNNRLTPFTSGKVWGCAFSGDGKYVAISHGSRQSDAGAVYEVERRDGVSMSDIAI